MKYPFLAVVLLCVPSFNHLLGPTGCVAQQSNQIGEASTVATTGRWVIEQRAGQFLFHGNSRSSLESAQIEQLNSLSPAISDLLGLPPADKEVHIVLFDSEREYLRYMKHYFPQLPKRRALFIQDRGPGMVFAHDHPELGIDLRHECVHALLNNYCRTLPVWLDEGLAEYFEVAPEDRLRNNPHLSETKKRIAAGFVPALDELEGMHAIAEMGNGQYRDSWAWVHFLLHRQPITRQKLVDYLTCRARDEQPEALSRSIVQLMPNWRQAFVQHFQSLE